MTPDQQIRAAAVQAAGNFMSSAGSTPEDFIMVSMVFASLIEHGEEAAYAQLRKGSQELPESTPQPTGPRPATLVEPMITPATPPPPTDNAWQEPERKSENVIPLEASNPVPPQQSKAMHLIDATRKTRARSIMGQASIAKVKAHMDNLMTDAEEGGLWDFKVATPEGEGTTLGAYLEALYESKGFASSPGVRA